MSRWTRFNRKFHRNIDGEPAPSRNDEWLFYQSLLGAWPLRPPGEEETKGEPAEKFAVAWPRGLGIDKHPAPATTYVLMAIWDSHSG